MGKAPTIKECFKVIVTHWGILMSGILSVPFTISTIFTDSGIYRTCWFILAFASMIVTTYQLWAHERRNVIKAEEDIEILKKELEPKVSLTLREEPDLSKKNGYEEYVFLIDIKNISNQKITNCQICISLNDQEYYAGTPFDLRQGEPIKHEDYLVVQNNSVKIYTWYFNNGRWGYNPTALLVEPSIHKLKIIADNMTAVVLEFELLFYNDSWIVKSVNRPTS